MADSSHIQWTDATWNVVTGCTRVSEGCRHCYIERTPPFRMSGRKFDSPEIGGTTGVAVHRDRFYKPMGWRKPRRIFVNSLSDLFHDDIPDGVIGSVWNTMALTPQHSYQILTKRPARMRSLLRKWELAGWMWRRDDMAWCGPVQGPLPNVWLGVSVEDQQWANTRIPALLETPAAVRWLSCEPLLGPVTLPFFHEIGKCNCAGGTPEASYAHERHCGLEPGPAWGELHWTVIGGESGPGARPMDPTWAASLVEQCRTAGVPAFVKQMGSVWARQNDADSKGGKWQHWPADLRVREYPQAVTHA